MRSPPSPLLANVHVDKLEDNFKVSPLQPRVLMRYLDDYIPIWLYEREKLEDYLKFRRGVDGNIKFTMDVGEERRLVLLDVEVIRSYGTLKRNLFRKKSYAGIMFNFESHYNYRMEISILRSMIIRSLRLMDVEFWNEELEKLTRIFIGYGYAREVLQRNILAVKSQWHDGDHDRKIKIEKESEMWICLPSCEIAQNYG
ncbi:unnamed protein product [Protopolystoma xenopodis]|uniref:Reverse transcriptase domain-containing protein n=1 Tax=Protopolystoma xenopodis TaxID=117903 RepID=A0A448WNL5_9PLAT|nr:unnamed protein product [Protopolystoma xenopodis]